MNIILCGPGRSGTTLFNSLFSYHKDFAWISGWLNKFPDSPTLCYFNQIYQNQFLGINWSNIKYAPKPAEAYGYWNHFFYPFTSHNYEFTKEQILAVKTSIHKIKTFTKKPHFVTKITGDTRYQILSEIFGDDLIFLWIERDPRVVVSSYIKQKWGYKNNPEKFGKLSMQEKIEVNASRYLDYFYQAKELNKKLLFYEDLCANPLMFFESLFSDLNLEFNENQSKIIENWTIKPVTWENDYSKKYDGESQLLINELLREPLDYYNYT